jgi:Fe-S-cluster-containing dehydrogenase component
MSEKWLTVFDVDKCTGCYNCVLATMDEHVGNRFPGYSEPMVRYAGKWIDIESVERAAFPVVSVGYSLKTCLHCSDPPCAAAAPDAITKREDGIVLIDPVKARGRRDIVTACPIGAITWNDELETPQQWNMDAHLLDAGWKESRASQACPTGALTTSKVSDAELSRMLQAGEVHNMGASYGLKQPQVVFRNVERICRAFVAGTVYSESGGMVECLRGAKVEIFSNDREILLGASISDAFGAFIIDGLSRSEEVAEVVVRLPDGRVVERRATLSGSAHLGCLYVGSDGGRWESAAPKV